MKVERGQPFADLGGDVLEMRRRTPDNGRQRDDTVVALGFRHYLSCLRDFEGTGNTANVDGTVCNIGARQAIHRSLKQAFGDQVVESADDDADA